MQDDWTTVLEPCPGADELEPHWLELEARAAASFFRSWGWIGSWLRSLPQDYRPQLLTVRNVNGLTGLAVLCSTQRTRRGLVRSAALHLAETGDVEIDAIAVEHNGPLAAAGSEAAVFRQALLGLRDGRDRWNELVVSGVEAALGDELLAAAGEAGFRGRLDDPKPYYYTDLDTLRDSGGGYLATLSRNSRYQVRRAMREFGGEDALRLEFADDLDQALDWFVELRDLHQAYWRSRGRPGAFHDEFRLRFHDTLIRSRFSHDEVHILRVRAGDEVLGYLYNFQYRGVVSNYQSGFAYDDNPKRKPGLVAHVLAIGEYLRRGASTYDFLMGDQRYKASLAGESGSMATLVVQKPLLRFLAEDALRNAWHRLQR